MAVNQRLERIRSQQGAAKLMVSGKYLDALALLKGTIATYGPHISIVMDIPACYYMIGDYVQFERYTLKAEAELNAAGSFLSEESFVRSALALGRMQEELGQFAKALAFYEQASRYEDLNLGLMFDVYAQRLRLKAFLGIRKDFEKDYRACEKALAAGQGLFPLTHALILADLFIGDLRSAEGRLKNILPTTNLVEQRLLVFDYIAEVLSQASVTSLENALAFKALTRDLAFADCDAFEQSIWGLLDGTCDLTRTSSMSLIGSLKFSYLAQKFAGSPAEKTSAATKWVLLLHGLSPNNRLLLESRWPLSAASEELVLSRSSAQQLQLDSSNRSATYDAESFIARILLLFAETNTLEISAECACEKLYAEPLKLETADRLRRAVARANLDIAKKLGLEKILVLRKNKLLCAVPLRSVRLPPLAKQPAATAL